MYPGQISGTTNCRLALAVILIASLAALAAAWIAVYGFDIVGCTLCVYQRVPYLLTAALAVYALTGRLSPARQRTIIVICAVLFFLGAIIAVYHTGLQQGWWSDVGVCQAPLPTESVASNLRAALRDFPARPPCDAVDWALLGLSLASLNFIYSFGLAFACSAFALRCRSSTEERLSHGD